MQIMILKTNLRWLRAKRALSLKNTWCGPILTYNVSKVGQKGAECRNDNCGGPIVTFEVSNNRRLSVDNDITQKLKMDIT